MPWLRCAYCTHQRQIRLTAQYTWHEREAAGTCQNIFFYPTLCVCYVFSVVVKFKQMALAWLNKRRQRRKRWGGGRKERRRKFVSTPVPPSPHLTGGLE